MTWRYQILKNITRLPDLLYASDCVGCQENPGRWCSQCQAAAQPIPSPICPTCGRPQPAASLCRYCQADPPSYTQARAWRLHTGNIRAAVHQLKYNRDIGLGVLFARHLAQHVASLNWPVDVVVPIALAPQRQRQRGYNQAAVLAYPLALALDVPYARALRRIRETRSQVELTRRQRLENVKGAFTAKPKHTQGKTILLVDDVMTTGATLNAAAQALREAGADLVYALTLARAE